MTIFDLVRSALLAGYGVQEKVKEFVDELVKKGELSESQGAKLVKEWSEKADKGASEWNKSLSEMMAKTLEKMNIPSKDEIEKLNKKIHNLSARVKKLEGAVEESETEAK
ncbi:MAG TPA: phasin family protein [Dissulfurispiraceae bacterium]